MKLEARISKSIYEYPDLYKCETYEQSRLKVLEHIFITLGNGFRFANTKDPQKGGYLLDIRSKHFDPPYGKEKFATLSDDFFKNKHFRISKVGRAKIVNSYMCGSGNFEQDLCIEIAGLKEDLEQKKDFRC